jgi:hypothetical protein
MPSTRFAPALALGALLAAGCGDGPGIGPILGSRQFAPVRVVNATTGTTAVALFAQGQVQALGTAVGANGFGGTCVDVPVGRALTFRRDGQSTELAALPTPNLAAGQRYTLVLYESGSTLQTALLTDAALPTPAAGTNALRFFNATARPVDVYVTNVGAALPATPSVSGLAPGRETGGGSAFGAYSSDNVEVRVYDTGVRAGAPRFVVNVSAASLAFTRVFTVVLTEALTLGSVNASFLVAPCG